MNLSRHWVLSPFQRTLEVFSKSNEGSSCHIVSKSVDEKFGIKPGKKVTFNHIEAYIDDFVEEVVPCFVDHLYQLTNELPAGTLSDLQQNFNTILQRLEDKLVEVNNLRSVITDADVDDFDLRICPAKAKIKAAIEHFFEISCSNYEIYSGERSTHRSHQARDLISFIYSDCESGLEIEADEMDLKKSVPKQSHKKQTVHTTKEKNDEISEESLELLNKDLSNLHKLMINLHSMVTEQGEVADSILDNVESAENHVEEGNKHLKKAAIIKAAMFPVVGAVVGGVIGGPIGLMAGMKVGSLAGGVAMAGVAGTVVGYQGGKMLKKKTLEKPVDGE